MNRELELNQEQVHRQTFESTRQLYDAIESVRPVSSSPFLLIYGKRLEKIASKSNLGSYYWELVDDTSALVRAQIFQADEYRVYLNIYDPSIYEKNVVLREAPKPLINLKIENGNVSDYRFEVRQG